MGKQYCKYDIPDLEMTLKNRLILMTGKIYKGYDLPSSNNDRCSMIHNIKYSVSENIGRDSKDIKNRKADIQDLEMTSKKYLKNENLNLYG